MSKGAPLPVSVVVPTHNRIRTMERLLNGLAAQTGVGDFEVVLVDDGSSDGTATTARAIAQTVPYRLQILRFESGRGAAAARNQGWRAASGRLLAFTDDDCMPDSGWLRAILKGLEGADVAVGRTRPREEDRPKIGPFSNYVELDHNDSFATCNIAYRREVLESLGGFDEDHFRYPYAEDTDLGIRARRAGYKDVFIEDALVFHDVHPSRFGSYLRSLKRLEGLVTLVALHPEARREYLRAGIFVRGVDKAVLIFWAALLHLIGRRRRLEAWLGMAVGIAAYVWQWDRSRPPARNPAELIRSLPLALVADSWTVCVMIRGSWRWRTLLI